MKSILEITEEDLADMCANDVMEQLPEKLHCFECEVETTVKYNKEGYPYCIQCGLKH